MSHLTYEQRYAISVMLKAKYRQKQIAEAIDKDKSVVSREIARNCDKRNGNYDADLAERKYEKRRDSKPKKVYFTAEIQEMVEDKLAKKYSPEQIVGVAKKQGVACVSHERIYQHIWKDKRKKGNLYDHLRTKGKRYRKRGAAKDSRGIIPDRVDISQRPKVVDDRERAGDLEIDTIIGKNHQGAILTVNDRASGLLKMKKLEGKSAQQLAMATIELLEDMKPFLNTITADNGREFAAHQTISKALEIDFYFARPYHSWERGANENLNGLIRQYIPKQTDFSTITDEYIKFVENELNNRPRKRHDFQTPNQIFNQLTNHQEVAFVT
jgi:IS30 family transposase